MTGIIRGRTIIGKRPPIQAPTPTPTPVSPTPTPTITPTPVVAYSYSVSPDGNVCSLGNNVTVYSSSAVLGIGSSLYQNSGLTIPTTYGAISNPNDPGQDYFVITVNTITSITLCD